MLKRWEMSTYYEHEIAKVHDFVSRFIQTQEVEMQHLKQQFRGPPSFGISESTLKKELSFDLLNRF